MKQFFTLLLLVFSGTILAQDISINSTSSKVFKDNKKHTSLEFSEKDGNGGFITIRTYYGGMMRLPKGYYIEHYDKDLNLVKETEMEIDKNQIQGMMVENGKIFIMESVLDKKADKFYYNVLESSLDAFDFKKKTLLALDESEVKKYFGFGIGIFFITNGWDQADSNSLGEVTFSSNRNFFCVNFDIKDKKTQTQRLYVYDKQFNKVFEKEFKRNVKDRLFEYENIDVDDETGAVYLLGKVYENNSKKSKKKGKANYHYELHKITATDQQNVSFKTDAKFVGSLFTVLGENGISCAGFYSDKNDYRYKGACRFNIDTNTMDITSKSFKPFTPEFVTEKYGKLKDKELRDLSLRNSFITPEGDIVINAEEHYITWTNPGMNGGSSRPIYHYNDIVSIRMNAAGDLLWARNINKRQATGGINYEYLSFSSTMVNDDTYLFINCSDKIRKLRNDRIEFKQVKSKKSNLYAIKIDKDGNYTFKSIVDDKDTEVPYFVRQGISTSNYGDEMVFIGRRKSKKQFLKLNVQ
ncbi:MAG: hypothetical protein AAFP76_01870 [Bacteroidota bacterium]